MDHGQVCILYQVYVTWGSIKINYKVIRIEFPVNSLEVAKSAFIHLHITHLKKYVPVIQQRGLIRYMPVSHQVPSVKLTNSVLLITKVGSLPQLRIYKFDLIKYFTKFSPNGLMSMLPKSVVLVS